MSLSYNRPLYLLPLDHRQSYVTSMFHFTTSLTMDEHGIVADSKQVIYEGFRQALGEGVATRRAGFLVDEEFGAGILRDAIEHDYVTALSTRRKSLQISRGLASGGRSGGRTTATSWARQSWPR
jgi:myo-inositol catabolism protein IolC